jgi:purine-binding chemotaxis protein CheW
MSEETHTRQLVVFALAGEHYALPIEQVHEIIRYIQPRSVASEVEWVRGVISLRGRIIPVYDLAAHLGLTADAGNESNIAIVDTGIDTIGVIVDNVDQVLTIEDDQLEQVPGADSSLIESIAKIDERLVVLINPSTIFATPGLPAA